MNLYDILGLSAKATPSDIKRAHRAKARQSHPDAGGSREDFEKVQQAYSILIDPVKRLTYDQTGSIDDKPTDDMQAILTIIQTVIESHIENLGDRIEYSDLLALTRDNFIHGVQAMNKQITATENQIKRYERIKKRIISKAKINRLADMLQFKIDTMQRAIAGIEDQKRIAEKALVLLVDYSFDTKSEMPFAQPITQAGVQQQFSIGPRHPFSNIT